MHHISIATNIGEAKICRRNTVRSYCAQTLQLADIKVSTINCKLIQQILVYGTSISGESKCIGVDRGAVGAKLVASLGYTAIAHDLHDQRPINICQRAQLFGYIALSAR